MSVAQAAAIIMPPVGQIGELTNLTMLALGKTPESFQTKDKSDSVLANAWIALLITILAIIVYYALFYYAMKCVCNNGMNIGEFVLAMCCTLPYAIIMLIMNSTKSKPKSG